VRVAEAQVTRGAEFEERPFDDGGVCPHEFSCPGGVERLARFHRQLSPGCSAAVDEILPAEILDPGVQQFIVQSVAAQVVKSIVNLMVRKPAPRLPDGVAVFDAVENYHAGSTVLNPNYSPQRRRERRENNLIIN